jgi:hypothetical protein
METMNQLAPITVAHAPALIAASGPRASYRFLEFFTPGRSEHDALRPYV